MDYSPPREATGRPAFLHSGKASRTWTPPAGCAQRPDGRSHPARSAPRRRPSRPAHHQLITSWCTRGIRESKNAGNTTVAIKLIIVLLVIAGVSLREQRQLGTFPNGIGGVLNRRVGCFLRVHRFRRHQHHGREECKNPQRDLPRA